MVTGGLRGYRYSVLHLENTDHYLPITCIILLTDYRLLITDH
jgi:hypothetical protein